MTQKEILEIALAQSASDSNCAPKDFLSEKNKIVFSEKRAGGATVSRTPLSLRFRLLRTQRRRFGEPPILRRRRGVYFPFPARTLLRNARSACARRAPQSLARPRLFYGGILAPRSFALKAPLLPLSDQAPLPGRFLRTLSARMEQRALRKTKGAGYSGNRSLRRGKIDRARGRLRRLPKYVADRNRRPARIPQPRRRFRFDERFGRRNTPSE